MQKRDAKHWKRLQEIIARVEEHGWELAVGPGELLKVLDASRCLVELRDNSRGGYRVVGVWEDNASTRIVHFTHMKKKKALLGSRALPRMMNAAADWYAGYLEHRKKGHHG